MKVASTFLLLLFTFPAFSGYYYTSQEGQTEALKKFDVTGKCLSHAKSFESFSEFWNSSNSKNKTKCSIDKASKQIRCITSHPVKGVESIAVTKWFDTSKACDSERKKYTEGRKAKKGKQKNYYYSHRDYKYDERGYGSVVAASNGCRKLRSSSENLKSDVEKIAKKEGFLASGKCQSGAFSGTLNCKKSKSSARTYVYFNSNNRCKKDLADLKSNYDL